MIKYEEKVDNAGMGGEARALYTTIKWNERLFLTFFSPEY